MPIKDLFSNLLLLRRIGNSLEIIAEQQSTQTVLLQRLAQQIAPQLPPDPKPADLTQAHATYGGDRDWVRIEQFRADCLDRIKREPTDDEIVAWLDGIPVSLD